MSIALCSLRSLRRYVLFHLRNILCLVLSHPMRYGVVTYEDSDVADLASLKRCSLDNATTYVHLPVSHFATNANAVFLSPSDIIDLNRLPLGALVSFVLVGTYFLLGFPFAS